MTMDSGRLVVIWDQALVGHYLSADGPFGKSPITYIDARPEEIAKAYEHHVGEAIGGDKAVESLLSSFAGEDVRGIFSGRASPPRSLLGDLGNFRYLFLTCLITAQSDDTASANQTHQFRKRLGRTLEGPGREIQKLDGIRPMWLRLRYKLDKLRAAGGSYRRLVLPDPARWVLIGYSSKISFPSWRDRNALARLLGQTNFETLGEVVRHLEGKMSEKTVGQALWSAWQEFEWIYYHRDSVPTSHRFWVLVSQLLSDRAETSKFRPATETTLTAYIEFEDEGAYFQLDERIDETEVALASGSFDDVLQMMKASRDPKIRTMIGSGVFILQQESPGIFTSGFRGYPENFFRIATNRNTLRSGETSVNWSPISADWWISDRIDIVSNALRGLFFDKNEPTLVENVRTIKGGVKVGSNIYLGRPAILPELEVGQGDDVVLGAVGEPTGRLVAERAGNAVLLSTDRPLGGRWDVDIRNVGGYSISTDLVFAQDATIHPVLKDPTSRGDAIVLETDCSKRGTDRIRTAPILIRPATARSVGQTPSRMQDLQELIYAMGPGEIAENKLIPFMKRILGADGPSPWDVLRLLQESGWLDAYTLAGWRARIWFLRKPRLVPIDVYGKYLVDGAIPVAWLPHIRTAVRSHSGVLEVVEDEHHWSVPTIIVGAIADPEKLATDLGWLVQQIPRPDFAPAPNCWATTRHDTAGRTPKSIWSWKQHRFVTKSYDDPAPGVTVIKWQRERGDLRDIYIVDGGSERSLTTCSRSAAILEGHRRYHRPMFAYEKCGLSRITAEGHLPIEITRYLRAAGRLVPAIEHNQNERGRYRYFISEFDLDWVASIVGNIVIGNFERKETPAIWRTRSGRRLPTWRYLRSGDRISASKLS